MKELDLINGKKYIFYSLKNENTIICSYINSLGFICEVNEINYSFKKFDNFYNFLNTNSKELSVFVYKEYKEDENVLSITNIDEILVELKLCLEKNQHESGDIKRVFYESFINSIIFNKFEDIDSLKQIAKKIITIKDI